MWLSCITAVSTAIMVKYTIDNPIGALEKAKSIVRPANSVLRKVSLEIVRD